MKKFIYLIIVLLVAVLLVVIFTSPSCGAKSEVIQAEESSDWIYVGVDHSEASFGITEDSTYFIHESLVDNAKKLYLVVVKNEHINDLREIVESDKEEDIETMEMKKLGEYFIAKPMKIRDGKTIFYFKENASKHFPSFNLDIFPEEDIITNQFGGKVFSLYF